MQVKGLNNVTKWLSSDIDKMVEGVVQQVGSDILSSARSKVHVDSGVLKASLNMSVTKDSEGWIIKVGSPLDYSVFEEFGTGGRVFEVNNGESYSFTNEDKQYASQFKRGGRNVMRYAHPYLHPAVFEHRPKLVKALADAINKGFRV